MPPRRGPKRRRTVTFPEPEQFGEPTAALMETSGGPDKPIDIIEDAGDPKPADAKANEEGNDDGALEMNEKEQEIWDSFREEYFEVLDQLPLYLHRSFDLIRELDEQVHEYNKTLQTTLRKYINKRRATATKYITQPEQPTDVSEPPPHASAEAGPDSKKVADEPMAQEVPAAVPDDLRQDDTPASTKIDQASAVVPPVPPPEEEPPESSRELLTTIAQSSEDMVHASGEKVSVARHAYDLIDRYIRDLDRAIKEEETSLSVGVRPGTHPASIILPEVVVPTLKAARRVTVTPVPEGFPLPPELVQETIAVDLGVAPEVVVVEETPSVEPVPGPSQPRRKTSRSKLEAAVAAEEEKVERPARTILKLTVPPLSNLQAAQAAEGAQAEERFCFCNQISYGNMVACDAPNCKYEWFHYGCVGLTRAPKGKWYCRDCAPIYQHAKKRSR